jgi:hypothetical protein
MLNTDRVAQKRAGTGGERKGKEREKAKEKKKPEGVKIDADDGSQGWTE